MCSFNRDTWPMRALRGVGRFAPVCVATTLVLFLALRPQPSLSDVPEIPRAVVAIFDAQDFLNNVAGFGGLTLTVHFAFARDVSDLRRRVALLAAIVGVMIIALELAQRFIPRRTCDWRDVFAGGLGVGLASMLWLWDRKGLRATR